MQRSLIKNDDYKTRKAKEMNEAGIVPINVSLSSVGKPKLKKGGFKRIGNSSINNKGRLLETTSTSAIESNHNDTKLKELSDTTNHSQPRKFLGTHQIATTEDEDSDGGDYVRYDPRHPTALQPQ